MIGYEDNHMRDTYKLYNPDTKRTIMTRDVKWADWKIIDPVETFKIFRKASKEYQVPYIEEDIIPTSEPEYKMPVHVILDEGERVRPNENSENSSQFTYHKKDSDTDTSLYGRLLNGMKKLDTS